MYRTTKCSLGHSMLHGAAPYSLLICLTSVNHAKRQILSIVHGLSGGGPYIIGPIVYTKRPVKVSAFWCLNTNNSVWCHSAELAYSHWNEAMHAWAHAFKTPQWSLMKKAPTMVHLIQLSGLHRTKLHGNSLHLRIQVVTSRAIRIRPFIKKKKHDRNI